MAHILVAEDERDIRELIKFTLTFAGHKITEAANGEEAVKLAKEVLPDLILTDVRMPKMTGYEACKAIKAEEIAILKINSPTIFIGNACITPGWRNHKLYNGF